MSTNRNRNYGNLIAVLLFGALLAPFATAAPESGKVTVAVGDVKVSTVDGGEKVLKAGEKVAVGATVKTGAGARAVIVITPQSAIRLAENSEALIELADTSVTPTAVMIDLKSGSLGALLKPNAASVLDFKIRTPSGVAAARGTFFSVAVKDGKGYAQVKEGRIEITPKKE